MILLFNCNCLFEIFAFLKYFSVVFKKTTKCLAMSEEENLRRTA